MPTIFLNPLCKESNNYTGGGNEEYYMNLIIDEIIPYLKASGIKYVRNSEADNSSSNNLCLFITSNSSPTSANKKLKGLNICYMPGNSCSRRLAKILCCNIIELYPNKEKVVMSPFSSNEIRLSQVIPSVLLKIAYRDNPDDSNWIKENIEKISENLATSICEYFAVPFITPIPMETKILNQEIKLYIQPNINSKPFTSLPSGSKVNIMGKWGNWYIIDYAGETGYTEKTF